MLWCHPETAGAARALDPLALRGVAAEDGEGSQITMRMPCARQLEILRRHPPPSTPRANIAIRAGGSGSLRMTRKATEAAATDNARIAATERQFNPSPESLSRNRGGRRPASARRPE